MGRHFSEVELNEWKAWAVLYASCAVVLLALIGWGAAYTICDIRFRANTDAEAARSGLVQRLVSVDRGYSEHVIWVKEGTPAAELTAGGRND